MSYQIKTIGILGGGQLGKMAAMAAARLGMRTCIYSDVPDCPASFVTPFTFVADYNNFNTLKEFADCVDVITYEFENIPLETVRFLQKYKPVYPDDRVLEIAQHRTREKKFLNDIGIPTTRWAAVTRDKDIEDVMNEWGVKEAILKTCRFGYDGKGQTTIRSGDDFKAALKFLKTDDAILEEKVDFSSEVSVIIARDKLSQTALYGPMLNEHQNHILARTTVPAPLPALLSNKARASAILLAEAVDLIGVLCMEFFVTKDGRLLANEIAPRPHNSGHWTIEACTCSQFEQQIRTTADMQIGVPNRHADAMMLNLIGDDVRKINKYMEMPNATVHLYGKPEIRDGRKMGHVTILEPLSEELSAYDQPPVKRVEAK